MELKTLSPYAGIIAPLLFISMLGLAIGNYPGYNPSSNYLSDLGVGLRAAPFFNGALILTGVLGLVFGYGLARNKDTHISGQAYMAGSAFLMLTGIFTEATGVIHLAVAGLFFMLMFASIVLSALSLVSKSRRTSYASFAAAGLVATLPLTSMRPVPEHIAVGAIMVWTLVMATKMMNDAKT